jgi:7-cyano-7-deazaguanine synthase
VQKSVTSKDNRRVATVLLSGGIDSTACVHFLQTKGFDVHALFFDYGQAAATSESKAARAVSKYFQCRLDRICFKSRRGFGSGELLGRNALLIFAALFHTRALPGLLVVGIHSGTTYFDCSEVFLASVNKLVMEHTDGRVTVVAPFADWSKQDVYAYFRKSGLPLNITYSCETGHPTGCGECLSCRDRQGF